MSIETIIERYCPTVLAKFEPDLGIAKISMYSRGDPRCLLMEKMPCSLQ